MKHIAEKGEIVVKKYDFRILKWIFGPEKLRAVNQTRKAKWCKMQVLFLKTDKAKGVKSQKLGLFTRFMANIFARTG